MRGIPATYLRTVEHDIRRASATLGLLLPAGLTLGEDGMADAGPYCENTVPQALAAQPLGGTWGGAVDSVGVFDPSLGASGSPYLVTYTWTDSLGNSLTDSVDVVVWPVPVVAIDSSGPFCENVGAQQLTASPPGGLWDGDFGAVDPSGVFNPFFGPLFSPYAVWYTVTDTNGCSATDTLLIEVLPVPVADVIEPLVLCPYDSIVQVVATPPGGSWSGDVDSLGQFDPAVGAGSYWGLYTVTDTNGCSGSSPASITVLDAVQAQLSPAGPFCADAPDAFLWASPFFGTYGGAADSLGFFSPQDLGGGEHLVTYTYACAGCCPTTDSLLVTVNPLPVVQLFDSVLCADLDTVVLAVSPPGGSWGGVALPSGVVLPDQLGAGTFPISYSVTDSLGCSSTLSDSIDVRPRPVIAFVAGDPICAFGPIDTLNALPAGGIWSGDVAPDGVLVPGADTTLVLSYTYGDSASCTATRDTVLSVHPLPDPLLVPAGPFCSGDATAQLVAFPAGGAWGGMADPSGTFDPATAALGANTVSYTLTDSLGCTGVDSMVVLVVDATPVSFGSNGPFCTDDGLVALSAFPAGGVWGGAATTYGNFDTGVPPGTYVVTYTYSNGVCTTEASDTITVDDCTFIRELAGEDLSAFPVPADDRLTILLPAPTPITLASLTDASGRRIDVPFSQLGDRLVLETSHLRPGTFILWLAQEERTLRTRFLVMH